MNAIAWVITAGALLAGLAGAAPAVAQSLDPVNQKGLVTLGAGYAGSTTEADVDRGQSGSWTSSGWGVAARLGLSRRWGAALSYQSVQDGEDFTTGETINAAMVDLQAYVTWLETKHSHWYAKVGVTRAELRSSGGPAGQVRDDAVAPSIGLGVDWGTRRLAFFFDWDVSWADMELIPGRPESLILGNTVVGLVTKF